MDDNNKLFIQAMDNFRMSEHLNQILDSFEYLLSVSQIHPDDRLNIFHNWFPAQEVSIG